MSPLPDGLLDRLRAEYREMPGMRLTAAQVQRLCGIERAICQEVLDQLVAAKFLWVNAHGAYARLPEGEVSRLRTAAAAFSGLARHAPGRPVLSRL
jgi:hypothetical protein